MDKNSKIFVAGGTGMVGSAIMRKLVSSGYENIVASYNKKKPITNHESRITFSPLDLKRQADTEEFFDRERPDHVFLAAAKVGGILANSTYKADFIYDNIVIAANVIHSSWRYGAKKLLNLGSSCIYPKFAPQPMSEDRLLTGPLEPTNEPYAIAKIAAIKLCRYYNEQYGTDFLSVMPTNLYGIGDNFNLETAHVLPSLIRKFHLAKLLKEQKHDAIVKDIERFPLGFNLDSELGLEDIGVAADRVKLWGTGEPFREFLYVDELADACLFLMENFDAQGIANYESRVTDYFINIGTGEDLTIRELANLVAEVVGFRGEVLWDTSKPDGTPRKLLDVSKIKSLGWQPKITLKEGIRRTYEWYRSLSA